MALPGFERLHRVADGRREPVTVAAAGGDDPSVLEALGLARDRGWVRPIVVGPEASIRAEAERLGLGLDGFAIVPAPAPAEADAVAARAVAEVREGRARMLMKGKIATPALLRAVLDRTHGLRTGRVVCQVVLMEVVRDDRRFVMADTGICVQPGPDELLDIVGSAVEVARALGVDRPRVALMAATESVSPAMPETGLAAELQRRSEAGEIAGGRCRIQGPLSFDLAYAASAADKKRVAGPVVGAADALVFPSLLAANLTVKAIMYTADCRFGGVLRGTSAPVVFMSRADAPATRLNSLALALALLEREAAP